jgi:type I restriction enzyme M protein
MELYSEALDAFAEAKQLPELFRSIFKDAFLPYRSPETLGLFLKEINYFDYTHPEELGNAYEYLLSIMSAQGDAGQFRTPRHIIDFIVEVLDPKKNETVLDPACGTGGFLISTYNHILKQHDGKDDPKGKEKSLTPDERKKLMNNLVGYDIDPTMTRIAQVNMYLHQFKNPKIFQYDSLTSDDRWRDKFDVIMANPPFMSPKGGIRPHSKFSIQSNRSEVLFVDYIASHLKPNGRAGIIVPEGIIFQGGKAYKQLRKMLIEGGLYAVVSLPAGVFNPYSGVKTSILLINNEIAKQKDEILFIKISNDGYDLGATKKPIEKNDLPFAISALKAWVQADDLLPNLTRKVSRQDLLDSADLNLSAERYSEAMSSSNSIWPLEKLGNLLEVQNGYAFDSSGFNDSSRGIPIVRIRDVNSGFTNTHFEGDYDERFVVKNGDLLVGMDGDFRATIWKHGNALLNQRVCRLQNFKNVKKEFVFYLLKSKLEEIHASTYAVTVKHLSSKQVQDIEIPLPPLEVQEQIIAELYGYEAAIEGAKRDIESFKRLIDDKVAQLWS